MHEYLTEMKDAPRNHHCRVSAVTREDARTPRPVRCPLGVQQPQPLSHEYFAATLFLTAATSEIEGQRNGRAGTPHSPLAPRNTHRARPKTTKKSKRSWW